MRKEGCYGDGCQESTSLEPEHLTGSENPHKSQVWQAVCDCGPNNDKRGIDRWVPAHCPASLAYWVKFQPRETLPQANSESPRVSTLGCSLNPTSGALACEGKNGTGEMGEAVWKEDEEEHSKATCMKIP